MATDFFLSSDSQKFTNEGSKPLDLTGKSLSEALIFASNNPQHHY